MAIFYLTCVVVVLIVFAGNIPEAIANHLHPGIQSDGGHRRLPRLHCTDGDPHGCGARHLLERGGPRYRRIAQAAGSTANPVSPASSHDGDVHRHDHRLHPDRSGDHGVGVWVLGRNRSGAEFCGLRSGAARLWELSRDHFVALSPSRRSSAGPIMRESAGIPDRNVSAIPFRIVWTSQCLRRHPQPRLCLAGGRHAETH